MNENVIEIRNLTRRFGKKVALDDVSINVVPGLVTGLVGENGSGKTTLIKHVLGLLKVQSGTVRVFALDPVRDPVGVLARIGYLSEERDLPEWMKIHHLMRYNRAFFPDWDQTYADQLRDTFRLDADQKIRTLSRGQKAQTGLLIALAHRPDLLILDEPSTGLDPVVRRDILGAIIRTVAEEGRTVFFSSHLLEEVERVADNVVMIHEGKIVLSGALNEIKEAHQRVTLRFSTAQTSRPELPGALWCDGEGLEWTLVCDGRLEQIRNAAGQLGADIVEQATPTLDEIFVARVKG